MLNVVIIEDEQNSLDVIVDILNNRCKVNISGTASTVIESVQLLETYHPDLVLLDVNLPDGTCFDILNKLESHEFGIIFITAFEEYALKAIKFSALDYLLKPINPIELSEAIKHAEKELERKKNDIKLKALLSNIRNFSDNLKKIVLSTSDSLHVIDIQDITRCSADGSYTVFYLIDKRKIMVSRVLKEYDEMLEEFGFIRVHKSHLININHLERIEKNKGYFVVMKDKSEIPVSVRKRERLINILNSL